MQDLQELRRNLAALVDQDRRRRLDEAEAEERERRVLATAHARFERAATDWMERLAPRLEMLLEVLPVSDAERTNGGGKSTLSIPWSREFPVAASLIVTIDPVDRDRVARVTIQPLLIPMLPGHPQPLTREFDLASPDLSGIDTFLDEGVLAFARAYLHVRDPESPYQTCRSSRRETGESRPPAAIEEPAITV